MLTAKPRGCRYHQPSKCCNGSLRKVLRFIPAPRFSGVRKAITMPAETGRQAQEWRHPMKQPLLWQASFCMEH